MIPLLQLLGTIRSAFRDDCIVVRECRHCGTTVEDGSKVCSRCGTRSIARYEVR